MIDRVIRYASSERFLRLLSQSSDLILVAFIMMIITMLIIPFSPEMIDMFISINLAVSISLMFVSIYLSRAVNLSVFPSLLLLTTLYRLGVNICSSRRILLHGYAGHVIEAFGEYVVGGNYIVGGVVFLIITIVNFIVIVKGGERVAEVAARFVLDGMPGKQMSIDADLRSGVIDNQQARQARLALQKESQLYGAMDGAMKFVKGDAIAGIVIACVNIVGGLLIGMFMHGMTAGEAARLYTLLSIGDGLVSQIPSILISLTAGIIITRVSSEEKEANLAKDIASQVLAHPKGLILAAAFIGMLGLVPEFPAVPFGTLSMLMFGAGIFFARKKRKQEVAKTGAITVASEDGKSITFAKEDGEDFAVTLPVVLETGTYVSKMIRMDRSQENFVESMIPRMRNMLYSELGVPFPGVHVRIDSRVVNEDEYLILLNEVPIIRGRIVKDHVLTNVTSSRLKRANIPYQKHTTEEHFPSLWVSGFYVSLLEQYNIPYWTPLEVVILHLSSFFRQYAGEFIGIQEMRSILTFYEKKFPDLIKEATRLIPLQKMTDIFKRLVQEQVSIKDLRSIMEALSEWAQTERDTILLTEYTRTSLKRYISYKYATGDTLPVYVIDPAIEEKVRGSVKQTSQGSFLVLDPDSSQVILSSVRRTLPKERMIDRPPVLMATMDVRRFVRKLIEGEFPDVPVISPNEVVPEIRVQPMGRISIN